ncbi:MAG: ferritin-like domain-containing protein [Methanocellales archaeon]|nr:ferritin-like domain-containing protein [Methanocellales archaeon]MDD3291631.1 ferritin-like domain-containing protein [Methanocellales archaeon]MDD5235200.1 ferritin-like domain-containing protein [Methanocellales archaeon]MDD5485414.1 ferritin-like domain-containing protein [Methanocellales archaeon]
MGMKGKEIVQTDVKKLIELLNKAYADEWLAYYQYWVAAQIVRGNMKGAVTSELVEHAAEELEHAEKLSERIMQLGGTPITDMTELNERANCKYVDPSDPDSRAILKLAIEGERCAIDVYTKLLAIVKDKDPVTYHIILDILKDEVEHEDDFETVLEDIKRGGKE